MEKAVKKRRGQRSAAFTLLQRSKVSARANTTEVSMAKRPEGRAPRRPLESTSEFGLKTPRHQSFRRPAPSGAPAKLRARLAVAEETLRAIRSGEVDTVMVAGKEGSQVFTLEGAEHAYRLLIESMNEGALTLTTDKMILYANQCFAKMVRRPLEQVIGASFKEFLAVKDRQPLGALLKRAGKDGSKVQLMLHAAKGSQIPVLISVRPLAKHGSKIVTVGMVVTDMTAARRTEELLRGFSQRLVQVQEAERERVAFELHGHITQLLCAILVRSQTLADKLAPEDRAARKEAKKLWDMIGQAATAVENISRNLRPSVLDHLGLAAVLRSDSTEFSARTGVILELNFGQLTARLPAAAELAFYRILQDALKNVEHHARARRARVHLTQRGAFVEMEISDDGVGFDHDRPAAKRKTKRGFGLLSMRERATGVGGTLSIQSAPGQGTTIKARVPLRTAPDGRTKLKS